MSKGVASNSASKIASGALQDAAVAGLAFCFAFAAIAVVIALLQGESGCAAEFALSGGLAGFVGKALGTLLSPTGEG